MEKLLKPCVTFFKKLFQTVNISEKGHDTGMSKSSSVKQCENFTRGRKTSTKTNPLSPLSSADADMASIAEGLLELKSLRSDFRTKFDNIDVRLTGIANALTALESTVTEIKQDVLTNATHIDEAEACINETEKTREKTETALESAIKPITFLEAKTDDLENRGRRKNLRIFSIGEGAEGTQPLFDFITDMLS